MSFTEIIDQEGWEQWYPSPPQVTRDKNNKQISVKGTFNHRTIKIKIKAPYQTWLDWEELFLGTDQLPFSSIEPCLSRPTAKNRILLKEYFEISPPKAANELFNYFILPANEVNPQDKRRKKSRGGSPYGLDCKILKRAKFTARELYVCLAYWLNKPKDTWPEPIKELIAPYADETAPYLAIKITMELFGIEVPPDLPKETIANNYYNKWIAYSSLESIKIHCQFNKHIPLLPYLPK